MGKREENKAQKRSALERAALALFLKQGYAFTSVEQIVAEADIARGTYYLYFTDKEELFRHLVEKLMGPLLARLEESRDGLKSAKSTEEARSAQALEEDLVRLLVEHSGGALLYLREARAMGPVGEWLRTLAAQIDDLAVEMILALQGRGLVRAMDARVAARGISGVLERLVFDVLSGAGNLGDFGAVGPEVRTLIELGVRPDAPLELGEGARSTEDHRLRRN